jgi:hypothetical protein
MFIVIDLKKYYKYIFQLLVFVITLNGPAARFIISPKHYFKLIKHLDNWAILPLIESISTVVAEWGELVYEDSGNILRITVQGSKIIEIFIKRRL